jgi:hypothetical protein
MDSIIGSLSNKFDALPIGKQINLMQFQIMEWQVLIMSKVAILDYLKPGWLEYAQMVSCDILALWTYLED